MWQVGFEKINVLVQSRGSSSLSFSHQRLDTKCEIHSPFLSTKTPNISNLIPLRHVQHFQKLSLFDDTKNICSVQQSSS